MIDFREMIALARKKHAKIRLFLEGSLQPTGAEDRFAPLKSLRS